MKRFASLLLILNIAMAFQARARIINIPADYSTIQAGVNASANGDTVLAAPGTYHERINFDGHNIMLGSNYLTTEDTTFIASTIIDGDSSGSVVNIDQNEDQTTHLIGFTITGGNSTSGGGIRCLNSSPIIEQNKITANYCYDWGAGIFSESGSPTVRNNVITGNNTGNSGGAGIFCRYGSPEILNNIISGNHANFSGGGICAFYSTNLRIMGNRIEANIGHFYSSGIEIYGATNVLIKDNYIVGNSGAISGGIDIVSVPNAVISTNIITENTAQMNAGIAFVGSSGRIDSNTVSYNSATDAGFSGGGIGCAGATVQIRHNLIQGNSTAGIGGGICISLRADSASIIDNLITDNRAILGGGGIYCARGSWPIVESNTIAYNTSSQNGGFYSVENRTSSFRNNIVWYNTAPQVYWPSGEVTYCNIEGGWPGEGNISGIPNFVDPASGDYNICINSPCLDSGDPSLLDPDASRSDIGFFYPTHPECPPIGIMLHASPNGSDSNGDGSDLYPFRSIQHCLDMARSHDTVFVRRGIYTENIHVPFKRLTILSNFSLSNDTLDIDSTIISGANAAPSISFEFSDSSTSLQGLTITQGHEAGIKCNFAQPRLVHNFIHGNDGSGIKCISGSRAIIQQNRIFNNNDSLGGGIACMDRSSAYIFDNEIFENLAYYGGGIICHGASAPIIKNNRVLRNHAFENGGGINCLGYPSNAIIDSNFISENTADSSGGGISSYNSWVTVVQNTLSANLALSGGGIYAKSPYGANATYRLNLIRNNYADSIGGGVAFDGYPGKLILNDIDSNFAGYAAGGVYLSGGIADTNTISFNRSRIGGGIAGWGNIRANEIIRNEADSCGGGIALFNTNESSLANNNINSNTAIWGGGIYADSAKFTSRNDNILQNLSSINGGGIYIIRLVPNSALRGDVIANNIADSSGGGIYCKSSWPLIARTQLIGNHSLYGGGLFTDRANPSLMNTVFYGNVADSIAGGLYLSAGSSPVIRNSIFWADTAIYGSEVWADSNTQRLISYSNIQGGFEGDGNIDIDPLFRNAVNGDFHLMAVACGDSIDSPCIDTGSLVDFDSLLSCSWGLATTRCDIGLYGGGRWQPVDIDDDQLPSLPQSFSLSHNYPNPFNARTTIQYFLSKSCDVTIYIFDILGRRIETLVNAKQETGNHQIVWDGRDNSSGIYFYRINAGEYSETKKMVLLK